MTRTDADFQGAFCSGEDYVVRRNGRFLIAELSERVMIPPRMFCEKCYGPTHDWRYLQDTRIVNTFFLCCVTWDVRKLKKPKRTGSILDIEGFELL